MGSSPVIPPKLEHGPRTQKALQGSYVITYQWGAYIGSENQTRIFVKD